MEIRFTKHALRRMRERAVSEDEIYGVFENPILTVKRKEALVIGRTNRGRYLTLVFDLEGKRLLTVWPSSRKQRRLYQERKAGET